MSELQEVLISAAILVLPVLAGLLVQVLQGYIKTLKEKAEGEIGKEKFDVMVSFVEILIRSAEQAVGLEGDQAKKDYVFNQLRFFADSIGFAISDEQLDALIEGVYNRIKEEIKK